MTIGDFFDKKTKKYCPSLTTEVHTSDYLVDFYKDCVEKTLPKDEVVKAWHELLKKYIKDPEAVFFIRRYGSTTKKGKWDIRRGFLTVFNNIKIVYVDNFFAQYFYAMAINGFVPKYDDFKKFILNRKIPYGYSVVSLERGHQAYFKGPTYPLNKKGWKQSHVFSTNNDYNFNYQECVSDLFPKGKYEDFIIQGDATYPYRKIDKNVSPADLRKIKAHFLRLVHPINYFLTPKVSSKSKLQRSTMGIKDIGEFPEMIIFMKYNLNKIYGSVFAEYQDMIMAPISTSSPMNPYIGLSYGMELGKSCSITMGHKVVKTTSKSTSSIGGVTPSIVSHKIRSAKSSFTSEQIAHCIRAYLFDGMSFRSIEQTYLGIPKRANGGGFEAKKIINSKGIDGSMKKNFYGKTITEAIGLATEPLKSTLKWMETNLKP